jgi:Holliday junction resolvase RusA-like endonuclease
MIGSTRNKTFFLDCIPPKTTHQAGARIFKTKHGTPFIGQSSKAKGVANDIYAQLLPHRPTTPYEGPLQLELVWQYPWRKSEKKSVRLAGSAPCSTRPDCDNLAKLFCDQMGKANFFKDDGQIYSLKISKIYSNTTGIKCSLTEVNQNINGNLPLILW